MDEFGVDIQFLSISTPGTYFSGEGLSLTLAQMTNDFIADICRKFPNRFTSFASLPLPNARDVMGELDRALNKLWGDGIFRGAHINGQFLVFGGFPPFYKELDKRRRKWQFILWSLSIIISCLLAIGNIGNILFGGLFL